MPFTNDVGLSFNCGYCRTFAYECLPGKKVKTTKKPKEGCNDPKESGAMSSEDQFVTTASDDRKSESEKVCLSEGECFRALFVGPRFVVGNAYFNKVGKAPKSLFERHLDKVKWAFKHGFHSIAQKDEYVSAFSTANWEALPAAEKSNHSLSNCVACATQFQHLQKLFPLKPFFCPPQDENASANVERVSAVCREVTGKPLAEFVANLGFKRPCEVEQAVEQAKKCCVLETQKLCAAECSKQLEHTTLPAILTTDTSKSRYQKVRMQQFFNPPCTSGARKKCYPVRPHECDNYPELCETLKTWDPASTPASVIAREFNVSGTDSSHRTRLLALDLTPGIVEMVPKSTQLRFDNSVVRMGVPPDPQQLAAIEQSMVDSGELKEGVPCFPVKMRRFQHGALVEIDAHGRKYPLVEVRQSLLNAHEQFMRLHSDSEIDSMTRDDVLSILQLGAGYSMHQFANATVEDLKAHLTRFERNR